MRRLFTSEFEFDPDKIVLCSNCSTCRWTCTSYEEFGTEAMFAGGRLRLLRSYIERNLSVDDDFVRAVFACSTCEQCVERCPIKVPYVEIIEDLRRRLVEIGKGPYAKLGAMGDRVYFKHNPFDEDPNARAAWLTPELRVSDDSKWGYFVGCTGSFRRPEIPVATVKMLNHFGIEPQILGSEEYCCCSPLIRTGQIIKPVQKKQEDGTKKVVGEVKVDEVINHNIDEFKKRGVEHLIYSCSGCYRTTTLDWPKFYRERGGILPFSTQHLSQFLALRFKKGELKWKNGYNEKVTYHDPCHLGRHVGILDAPREVINSIPGIELVEMERNRYDSKCCGAGGGFKAGFGENATNVASRRLDEALETGATTLISSCVFCKLNFLDAVKRDGHDIKVVNIEDLFIDLMELT
ncbi:MAG: (Fe-S)-binding protein [Candidatus Thorarchaeota archaeon]